MIEYICKSCGNSFTRFSPLQTICPKCASKKYTKPRKALNKKGHQAVKYDHWRDTIAKPYLDKRFGHVCNYPYCRQTEGLEVDHIKNRGSRADLKMRLDNVQYLCHEHHRQKTYHTKA